MSLGCSFSQGYDLPCSSVAGIKQVYIGNFDGGVEYTTVTSEITAVTNSVVDYYTIEQKIETAEYTETIQASFENGTVFNECSLTITLFNNTKELAELINTIKRANLSVIIEDNAGNYWLLGGADAFAAYVSGGDRSLGKALGDLNGATLTIMCKSLNGSELIDPTLINKTGTPDPATFNII